MDTHAEPTSKVIVGVLVTRTYDHRLAAAVREHGATFAYETHATHPELALRVSCLCPQGHGVAGIPWRGWLSTRHGRYDLADIPAPAPRAPFLPVPAVMEIPEDLRDLPRAETTGGHERAA